MASQGEGSRGGKIIGHTKSGLPIYASQQTQDHSTRIKAIKAGSFIGGGIGVGVYTGMKSASLVKQAGSHALFSRGLKDQYKNAVKAGEKIGPLFSKTPKLDFLKKEATQFAKSSQDLAKSGFRLKTLGSLVAGTLIGIGVNEGLKDRPELKDNKKAQALAIAAPGVLGAVAAGTGFYKKLGGKSVSVAGAAKFAIKNLLLFK